MPFKIIPVGNNKVKVVNKKTGKVLSKKTTIEKAKKQINIIEGLDKKILYQ